MHTSDPSAMTTDLAVPAGQAVTSDGMSALGVMNPTVRSEGVQGAPLRVAMGSEYGGDSR